MDNFISFFFLMQYYGKYICFPGDFLCRDRRRCISQTLVCDGWSHCFDASDERNCQSFFELTFQPGTRKCRHGSRLCADGSACVLFSHVCDGQLDCSDGSDEAGCSRWIFFFLPSWINENFAVIRRVQLLYWSFCV